MNVHRRLLFPWILATLLLATGPRSCLPYRAGGEDDELRAAGHKGSSGAGSSATTQEATPKRQGKSQKAEEERLRAELSKRFEDNGNGTASDSQKGLVWTTNDGGADVDWNNAEKYCTDLELGGRANLETPDD